MLDDDNAYKCQQYENSRISEEAYERACAEGAYLQTLRPTILVDEFDEDMDETPNPQRWASEEYITWVGPRLRSPSEEMAVAYLAVSQIPISRDIQSLTVRSTETMPA